MNLIEKSGVIIMVGKQLNDIMEHAWREWDVEGNLLKDDENAKFNELLRVLQPYHKQINNTFKTINKKTKPKKAQQGTKGYYDGETPK